MRNGLCVCCVLCVCVRKFGGLLCSGGEDASKKMKLGHLGVGGGDIRNFFSKTNLSNSITHSLWHSCNMLSGNRSSLAHIMTWDFRLFILLSKCTKLMHFTIKCRIFSPGGACPRTPLEEMGFPWKLCPYQC